MKKHNVILEDASEHTDDTIPIYWDDLTKKKQEEILAAFGDNCNYDVMTVRKGGRLYEHYNDGKCSAIPDWLDDS